MEKKETEKKVVKKEARARYNLDACNNFADNLAQQLKLDLDILHINRKESYDAPRLNKHGKQVCWILPRNNKDLKFSVYLFVPNQPREIIDCSNDNDVNNAFKRIEEVTNTITDKKEKVVKKSKKEVKEPRDFSSITRQISNLKKGKKMVIPAGFDEKNGELTKVVKNAAAKIENELIVKIA